jgi:hypothetical protein
VSPAAIVFTALALASPAQAQVQVGFWEVLSDYIDLESSSDTPEAKARLVVRVRCPGVNYRATHRELNVFGGTNTSFQIDREPGNPLDRMGIQANSESIAKTIALSAVIRPLGPPAGNPASCFPVRVTTGPDTEILLPPNPPSAVLEYEYQGQKVREKVPVVGKVDGDVVAVLDGGSVRIVE